ncbi:hypothetical protein C4D60_Mb10t00220 [Musa balbisiana]|uniref:UBC core domain-containing protein n=1 Tax=Musa balbisiana TaxID=52838 RepID=A0A4S8ITK6_MUSBA|nr:hypothetical protein C4D60_Mb10t00220 [Musa balbisiana]
MNAQISTGAKMMSDYTVETTNDGLTEFNVEFHGPKQSPYEGGVWKVRVELPDAYPYKSPSIGFLNKIFHPNLLLYPNPADPLNGDAASLLLKDQQQYEQKVKEYCERYAKREKLEDVSDGSDEDISDDEVTGSDNVDIAGDADP